MDLTFNKLADAVAKVIEVGRVPMVTSKPGVGKSALAAHIAELYTLELIDIRLTTYDQVSLNGYPTADVEANRSEFIPMSVIPLDGRDTPPKGKVGWLIIFDELTSCVPAMQAAAFKIVLDRYVGEHKIHDQVFMMAAGNGAKDSSAAHRMTAPMKTRLIHFGLADDSDGWCQWAAKAGLDHRIISFIDTRPELLNNFHDVPKDVTTYACQRSWEMLSDCIIDDPAIDDNNLSIVMGAVGESAAAEFNAYCNVYLHLPSFNEIVKNPMSSLVPSEPSSRYAVVGLLANGADKNNIASILQYVKRIDPEYEIMCARRALAKDKTLQHTAALRQIIATHAREFDFI